MPNNLFFSYELAEQENRKEQLDKAIQNMGNSTPLTNNCWYVNSPLTADEATRQLSRYLTDEDILVVADTSNDQSAWFNLEEKKARRVTQNWKM
ncbi:hypothetical protein [Gynuella sunshinyii]|uniref:Uncharacterized protein n=1 Tax=Gynuella sunshinyii YC6258 TaxID=1445510 RepID=A0A0C5VUX0_9GAMM|nr:hypothetical protein [Gynuella sunshinyii]AJQ94184.1 hypothetical Protein YC6258_02146 [Gynuella sunshinyii YC6258]